VPGPILTINAGSSTIKFGAFHWDGALQRLLTGNIEGIGRAQARLAATDLLRAQSYCVPVQASDHAEAADALIDWLGGWKIRGSFRAVGHRVVHGGLRLNQHQAITREVMDALYCAQPLAPAHLPRQIVLIEAFERHLPGVSADRVPRHGIPPRDAENCATPAYSPPLH